MSPIVADAIRKVLGYAIALALTLLVFHIFSRLANGTLKADDPAIYALIVLSVLAVWWVSAARRIRRGDGDPKP